jgi:hypothetical protein
MELAMILINSFIDFLGGDVRPLDSSAALQLARRGQAPQATRLAPGANCFFVSFEELNLGGLPDMPPSS